MVSLSEADSVGLFVRGRLCWSVRGRLCWSVCQRQTLLVCLSEADYVGLSEADSVGLFVRGRLCWSVCQRQTLLVCQRQILLVCLSEADSVGLFVRGSLCWSVCQRQTLLVCLSEADYAGLFVRGRLCWYVCQSLTLLVCLSEADSVGLFVKGRLTCMMEQLDSGTKLSGGTEGAGAGVRRWEGGLRWGVGGVLISEGGSYELFRVPAGPEEKGCSCVVCPTGDSFAVSLLSSSGSGCWLLEVILCYCTLPASLSGTFPGGHPMLLHTPSIAFRHLPGGHPMLLHTSSIAFRHLSWRSSYATAHSQHRFPAPFLEVILCYCTLPASLSGTFLVGPMTRLSADTWDHRDVRTVTWNHGYDGLWSESQQGVWRPQQAYGSNQVLFAQPQTIFSTPRID